MNTRVLAAAVAALSVLPAYAQTPTGSIQGRVNDAKTGAVVRFATVTLAGPLSRNAPAATRVEATADEQGRFTFNNLAAGDYAVRAIRDGYTPATYVPASPVRPYITLKEGEAVSGISIRMPPCGVIAGKVVNEKGEPVANVELVALRYYYGAWLWRPPVTPQTPLKTYSNDIGEFRISNLTAGPYIVRAAAPPLQRATPGIGYPSVFYPNALHPEEAEPVTVASGAVSPASIVLRPGPSFRISGHIDAGGSSEEICFGLAPKRYNSAIAQVIGRVLRFAKDGNFIIDDVPPGSYVFSTALCHGIPPLGAIEPIEVSGDINGLNIPLTAGRTLSGVVKAEGVNPKGLGLILYSPELLAGFTPRTVAREDGSFVFERVLPRHHILGFGAIPPGAYVKSVKYAGREVPASGFEIDGDAPLEITISALNAAQLSGSVVDRAGNPAPYARITAIPSDDGPAESAADVTADEKGAFTFPALRPGAYKLLAWEVRYNPFGIESADPMLPVIFDSNARTVNLLPGAPSSVTLTWNTEEEVNRARASWRQTLPRNQ